MLHSQFFNFIYILLLIYFFFLLNYCSAIFFFEGGKDSRSYSSIDLVESAVKSRFYRYLCNAVHPMSPILFSSFRNLLFLNMFRILLFKSVLHCKIKTSLYDSPHCGLTVNTETF